MAIAFQDEVKKSFSRVKKDMLDLKRTLNQERLTAGRMNGRMRELISKDEFYSFIKRLGERLDGIDVSLEAAYRLEAAIKNLEEKIRSVSGRVSRREDLNAEMRELSGIKSRLASLENSAVDRDFLSSEVESLRRKAVDKDFLGKKEKGLKKELDSIRKFVEASIVEVDLGQYVTKKEFEKKLSKIDDLNSEVARISADTSNLDARLESAGSGGFPEERSMRPEISIVSESLDSLKEDFEKLSEKTDGIQEETIKSMSVKIEKEFEDLKETIVAKRNGVQRDPQPGIIPNIKRGVSVFFKDGESSAGTQAEKGRINSSGLPNDGERRGRK